MKNIFTPRDTWSGGFYELAMEFAPHSDKTLEAALKTLWELPALQGCYMRPDLEPSSQPRVDPSLTTLLAGEHLRGIARLPNGTPVACGTYLVRGDNGPSWLGFYVPLGALATAYEVGGYPFEVGPAMQRWRQPLENWLAEIGKAVFVQAPFQLGLVGFEVSGTTTSAQEFGASGAPDPRPIGYLLPAEGKLTWYPTNQWQP
jgi:hypothetical protein